MSNYIDIARAAATLAKEENPQSVSCAARFLIECLGTEGSLDYLRYHCLSPLCFRHYSQLPEEQQDARFAAGLKADAIRHIALEKAQLQAMDAVRQALDSAGIPYAFFKGCATRLYLYDNPYERPAADVDVLVCPADRESAIDALQQAGLVTTPLRENLTHEITLMHGLVEIDLHWHILRPGRLAASLTTDLLETRVEQKGYWCLFPHASLLVLLLHPAYAKYVNSPWAKHIRLLDIERTLASGATDWDLLLKDIVRLRARTAAWCTVTWLQTVMNLAIPDRVLRELAPNRLKRWYLRRWILHGLVQRHHEHRFVMRLGLSLFLHDRLSDALGAIREYRRGQAALSEGLDVDRPAPNTTATDESTKSS